MNREFSLLTLFASNKTTNGLLLCLAINIIFYGQLDDFIYRSWLLIIPIFLLTINFLVSFLNKNVLFKKPMLLIFHIALLVLVVLMAIGNLTYLKATFELASGEEFNGKTETMDAGIWHRNNLDKVKFINRGFSISYHKGIKRSNTYNTVSLINEDSQKQEIVIGDHIPLVVDDYRFYTTHNKGFAPVFSWIPVQKKQLVTGAVHLPGYPINELKQAREWKVPGTDKILWTMLVIQDDILPEDRDFSFTIPKNHYLVIRENNTRYEMRPGDEIKFKEGVLRYEKLDTWMGYKVHYDLSKAWLLGSCIIGILSLFIHYINKFRTRS